MGEEEVVGRRQRLQHGRHGQRGQLRQQQNYFLIVQLPQPPLPRLLNEGWPTMMTMLGPRQVHVAFLEALLLTHVD